MRTRLAAGYDSSVEVNSEKLCEGRGDNRWLLWIGNWVVGEWIDAETRKKCVEVERLLLVYKKVLGGQVTAQASAGYDINVPIVDSGITTGLVDPRLVFIILFRPRVPAVLFFVDFRAHGGIIGFKSKVCP